MRTEIRHFAAVVGCLALLAGCVSAPRLKSSEKPWMPPARAQSTNAIWQAIRELSADIPKPATLAELADIALRNNSAIRKTWSDAAVAAARVEQARGYFMPTVVGTAEANRQRTQSEPEGFDQNYLQYGPGLQVNYLVFSFGGGRKAAVEQALQTVYAANYTFNRSIQDVLLAVETAYYGLVSAEAGVVASEASAKDAKVALDAAQALQEQGIGTALDVLQAKAGYDQALYNLANAQGQCKSARGGLAQSIGVPADTDVQVAPPTADVPTAIEAQDMRQLIDDALNRRPDIAALRSALAAGEAAVKVTGSSLWPSLYLDGAATRDYYDNVGGKAFQDRDWSYNAGVSLQWTLFDGLQTVSAKRAALAQAESARAQLKQAELAASADVWMRYFGYQTALRKHEFSSAYLKSASASYDLALDSYKAGLKSVLDLLNAEAALAQARSQQIAVRQEAFVALAELAYATGLLERGGAERIQDIFSTSTRKDMRQ